jgi:hypothetical protein
MRCPAPDKEGGRGPYVPLTARFKGSPPDLQSMRVLIILSIRSCPAFGVSMMVFANHLFGSASPHENGYLFGVERRIVRYVPRIGEKKLKLMWSRL